MLSGEGQLSSKWPQWESFGGKYRTFYVSTAAGLRGDGVNHSLRPPETKGWEFLRLSCVLEPSLEPSHPNTNIFRLLIEIQAAVRLVSIQHP